MLNAYTLVRVSMAGMRAGVAAWKCCFFSYRVAPTVRAADAVAIVAASHALGG